MAQLVFDIYGKRTSVLYDISAITDLISSESSELLGNLLYFSTMHIYQNRETGVFGEYWKMVKAHLTLQ